MENMHERTYHLILLCALCIVCVWSAVGNPGWIIWWFEVLPAVIGVALLIISYPYFKFTPLVYSLIWIHCVILFVGGYYTYEAVPLFNEIRDALGQARNNYDKVGHFAQGFIPAMVARELLIRTSPLRPGKWLAAIILLCMLGISAAYEIIEWWAAAAQDMTADEFLGSQGDMWDAQKDMLWCFAGACASLLLLSKIHNRQLRKISAL